MYKLSSYNTIWKAENGNYLLYNSMSSTILQLSEYAKNNLINGYWENFSKEEIELFTNGYIILQSTVTNEDIYRYNFSNIVSRKDRLGIFLVPSRVCNLSCTYCMQNNLFGNSKDTFITKEVIDGYYEWLSHYIKVWDSKRLDFIFYGGEPLVTDIEILRYLFKKFSLLPIMPRYKIITNGTTLMKYKEFFPYMDRVQITIDGRKSVHDERRIFKDGSGTYDLIVKNMLEYIKSIKDCKNKIIIRFNVDKYNRETLLDDIINVTKDLPMERIGISINPVDPFSDGVNDFQIHGNIQETAEAMCKAQEFLFNEYGTEPHMWRINCGISSLSQWSFDTEGSIYKCPGLTGEPDRAVTSLHQSNFNPSFYKLVNREIDKDCIECNYLGICGGGCPRQSEFVHETSCKKPFFDIYVPRMIELRLKYKAQKVKEMTQC